MVRGIERSDIFRDTADYESFLTRLGNLLKETSIACYAWVLMPNHVHLLIRSGLFPVSSLMRRLLTGYAQHFNRRHLRVGHLFQNRYKSILCEEEPYLLELVRYIHLNPVRAGMVEDMAALKKFPWSGHATLMGRRNREWQDTEFILNLFHGKSARSAYRAFVEKGIAQGKRTDLTGGGLVRSSGGWIQPSRERLASDERILGGSEFVTSTLTHCKERIIHHADMETLIATACAHAGIDRSLIESPGKKHDVSRIRAVIAHVAFDILRMKGVDIAGHLNISPSAISKLAQRGRGDALSEEVKKVLIG